MEENNVYAQAKLEYTNQLIDIVKDFFFNKFIEIYKSSSIDNKSDDEICLLFRNKLEQVPNWNQNMIDNEVKKIECDWLDDLLTAIYVTHTKILLSISKNKTNKIDLVIPTINNFIHKCFVNIARELWKNPYLYKTDIKASEYQKNIYLTEKIIENAIQYTIRKTLPVKDILKDNFNVGKNDKFNNRKKILNKLRNMNKYDHYNSDDIDYQENSENQDKIDSDIYESNYLEEPSESQIIKNTSNIEVNDSILKDNIPEKYDNVDIFDKTDNKETYESNLESSIIPDKVESSIIPDKVETTIISDKVETTIIPDKVETTIIPDKVESSIISDKVETNDIYSSDLLKTKDKLIKINKTDDTNEKIKSDKNETDTLDNFFDDLDKMNGNDFKLFNK